ncbi:MAG TPA: GntR family transcriptional regulator [Arachnia sp.]|nr:GntR family transcriptional regulator [Arachnia sp.]
MTVSGPRQLVDSVPSLVDVAQDYIRTRIASGDFPPGHRLKERDLSDETGISRIPIREAIRSLASEGFVTLVPRRGAVVTELQPEILDEIFEVREALEVQECALAAKRASREEIDLMRASVEAAELAARSGDAEAVNAANARFHEILVDASHNDTLAGVLRPLKNRLNWILRQNDDVTLVCKEHRDILEAIASGDVDRARAVATSHVATSKQLALAVLFDNRQAAANA